jgi:hypothetical protein
MWYESYSGGLFMVHFVSRREKEKMKTIGKDLVARYQRRGCE